MWTLDGDTFILEPARELKHSKTKLSLHLDGYLRATYHAKSHDKSLLSPHNEPQDQ